MRMFTLTAITVLHCLLIPGGSVMADPATKTLSPYFQIQGADEGVEQFPLKHTSIKTVINGVIADVRVTQRYANTGTTPINASYIFPASTRAAVHGMQMQVGEDVVKARIEERQAAKKAFNDASEAGQSASLLEQQRPNVFSMDVANIMPGDTVAIELHYSELLVPENGVYSFVYPTVVGPRYSTLAEAGADDHQMWVENPYLTEDKSPTSTLAMEVVLAAGLPLQKVACNTHKTDVTWDSEAEATIKLAADETRGGDRDFILDYRLAGDKIHSGLMVYEGEEENFFMLMVQPPRRVIPEHIPPREYLFVVDVSGSMNGFPLDTAKSLLKQIIGGLRPSDSFNVILFAGAADVMAPRSLPATAANIQEALQHIDERQGGGGTELHLALKKGLALPRTEGQSRTMVIVSDGYIVAEKEVFGLIADNLDRSNVFAFGIGSSVNRYLIEGMAKAGQGEPFVVTDPRSAEAVAGRFHQYIQAPLLTGIQIDFEKFEAYDMEPKVTADLFAERPLIITGKWRGRPEGTVTLKGTVAEGPYAQTFTVSPHMDVDSPVALPFLWARTRLGRLSDFNADPDDRAVREEVTRLGIDYQMLTAYTSFVAVHEQVRNTAGPARDVDQPLPLPRGVSNMAVGSQNVPEPDLVVMALILSLVAVYVMRRRKKQQALQHLPRAGR